MQERINIEIRNKLDWVIESYKLLAKDIDNLERALALSDVLELSLVVSKMEHDTYTATFYLNRIKELARKKRVSPQKLEDLTRIIQKAITNFAVIYVNSDNIERHFRENNMEPIDRLLDEIKQDYKDIEQYISKIYEFTLL